MLKAKRYREFPIDTFFAPACSSVLAPTPTTTLVPAPHSTAAPTPGPASIPPEAPPLPSIPPPPPSIPASAPALVPAPTPTPAPALVQEHARTPARGLSIPSERHCKRRCWWVEVIDEKGVIKEAQLKVTDVEMMKLGQRIVVHFNEAGQPVGEAGGIVGGFIGAIASDVNLFPISYRSWRKVPDEHKEKFYFEDAIGKHWILGSIARHWRDNRNCLFKEFYDKERSKEKNILKHPESIPQDMWADFVEYRLDPTTLKICETNVANRKKLLTPHTGGSKSFARKRHEMEIRSGKPVSRGALYVATHKRKDGSYVNDEARIISEKICNIEAQQTSSPIIGQKDSLTQVLGPEHSGRVRGLGFGPIPSKIFGLTTYTSSNIHSGPNAEGGVSTEKLAELESQLESQTKKLKTLVNVMQYTFKNVFGNAQLLPELVKILYPEGDIGDASPSSSSASFAPQS